MSFDLYFAGGTRLDVMQKALDMSSCRLFSQLNDRRPIKLHVNEYRKGNKHKIFIDSGAYSAWNRGVQLDIDEYIQYLNNNTDSLTLFASVDYIPINNSLEEVANSPIKSWQNYLYMREHINEKDKLLPVFHLGEDFKYLSNMLNTKLDGEYIPYIGLGGTVAQPMNSKIKWYNTIFKIIKDSKNPNVKTHAFGMTSLDTLENYPFTSADSTTWKISSAYGNILTSYGKVSVSPKAKNRSDYIYSLPQYKQDSIKEELSKWQLTIEECEVDANARTLANLCYLQEWADNYKYKGNNRYQKRLF